MPESRSAIQFIFSLEGQRNLVSGDKWGYCMAYRGLVSILAVRP